MFTNWFRKKVYFDFGGSIKPLTYPTPKKAPCPANVTEVKKYAPIQYNIMYGAGRVSGKLAVQAHEQQVNSDGWQEEVPQEQTTPLPIVQHQPKAKSYTLRIQPVIFTKRIRNDLVSFVGMYPNLRKDFLEEAKRTLAVNIGQIANALRNDLSMHIDNMRTVYDVFATVQELEGKVNAKVIEIAERVRKGCHPDEISALNETIKEMQQARNALNPNYAAPIRGEHAKGKRLVYHMKLRINKSLDEIEHLKSFYSTICRTIGVAPPIEFKVNRKTEESELIKEVFEKEIISAMKMYGLIQRKDGTFEISVIDLGGGEENNDSNNKEKLETDV